MKNFARCLLLCSAAIALLCSCNKTNPDDEDPESGYNRVFILYSAGFHNLSNYLASDQQELIGEGSSTMLPLKSSGDVVLIVSHLCEYKDYDTPTPTYLVRASKGSGGNPVLDTLKTYPSTTKLTDNAAMKGIFNDILSAFPAKSYGALISSHGSGWLPEGYYTNLKIKLNSIGAEYSNGGKDSDEMEISELAGAIPMKLDYLLLDACLMGGVETAYELRGVTDRIAFSGTEIMANGFAYDTILSRLFPASGSAADLTGVCSDYFAQYKDSYETTGGATISLVDCTALEGLAALCGRLFEDYREEMAAVDPDKVQGFFRYDRHFFYDLLDIMDNAGITAADRAELAAELDKCVLYKAHTPEFLSIDLDTWCGLSMYLPADGNSDLDKFYKGLQWNAVSGLVK